MMRLPTLAALTAWTMLPQAFFPAGAAAAESLSLTNLLDENLAPREIVYRTVAGRDLKLYVFDPPGLKEGDRRPAVMCIHGGSWMSGSPALFFPHSRYFAARGAVAISVEYRLTHQGANVAGTIFDCLSDCRAALRFMQTNAVALKLDPARIAVAGDSAGGHLAACLGIPVATEDSTPGAAKDTPPAALLLYNPELDLTTLRWAQSSSGVAIYGAGAAGSLPIAEIEKRFGKTPPERARALSPIFAIAKGQPPVLLMQGDKDTCVPVEQIRRFDQAYREAGNRCDYVELAGVAHAFVLPRYTAPDALVVKAIRRSDEFLAAIGWLAGPPTLQAAAEAAPVASSQPMAISRTQTNDPSPWKLHAPLPLARHDLQLVAWQGKLIAISGANDLTVSSVDSYDPATNAWSPRAPIPDRRGWFGAALLDGKIYCIGGKRIRAAPERRDSGDASPYEYRASLNIYDPTADCWSIGTPMRDPRAGCQAVALEGKLYVIGGDNPKLGFLDRVEIYDPAANTWQNGTALPDSREDLGAAAAGGKIYAIGGVKHSVRGDVFIFDPK
ncbi:MAG: alpha/beta hydrolase fold domain-containing protein, partial [Kiritimatiellia bacterium]